MAYESNYRHDKRPSFEKIGTLLEECIKIIENDCYYRIDFEDGSYINAIVSIEGFYSMLGIDDPSKYDDYLYNNKTLDFLYNLAYDLKNNSNPDKYKLSLKNIYEKCNYFHMCFRYPTKLLNATKLDDSDGKNISLEFTNGLSLKGFISNLVNGNACFFYQIDTSYEKINGPKAVYLTCPDKNSNDGYATIFSDKPRQYNKKYGN